MFVNPFFFPFLFIFRVVGCWFVFMLFLGCGSCWFFSVGFFFVGFLIVIFSTIVYVCYCCVPVCFVCF